jgi:hypothetical protein
MMDSTLRRVQYLLAKMDLPADWIETIQADIDPAAHRIAAKDGAPKTADVRVVVEGVTAYRFYQRPVGSTQDVPRGAVYGHYGTVGECADSELAVHLAVEVAWLYRHPDRDPKPRHYLAWST